MNKRFQIDNDYTPDADTEQRPLDERYFYGFILLAVLVLFGITYPYHVVRIPSAVLAVGGVVTMTVLTVFSYLRPQYFLASIVFCVYIPFSGKYAGDFGGRLPMGLNMTNMLLFPIMLQWFMQRTQMKAPLVRLHAPDLPLLFFCLLSSMAVLRVGIEQGNVNFAEQIVRLKRWLLPFFIYFLFVNTKRNEKGVKLLVVSICVTLTAVAILTMKESFDIGPGGSWDRIRVRGVLGSPNGTGAFFVYYSLIFLGLFLNYWRQSKYSWLLIIPFLLCGRAMTLANSRGGMIAFTLAILATLWFRSKVLFLIGLSIVIFGFFYPQYLPETISGRLFSTLRPSVSTSDASYLNASNESAFNSGDSSAGETDAMAGRLDSSAEGRRMIWMTGLRMFMENPWFGYGYGEFPRRIGDFNPTFAWRDPHNTYLGIAVEMGGFALFFFVLTLLILLRSSLRVYKYASDIFMRSIGLASVGMLFGVLCANIFGSRLDTVELTAYLWILSAIVMQYDKDLVQKMAEGDRWQNMLIVDPWQKNEEEELL
jgi:putative inorganic carbon (hco3(-)) transporter